MKELKKTPKVLTNRLWRLLKKYALVRSPYEEREYLFSTSSRVQPPDNVFAANIARSLYGAFQLNSKLGDIRIEFVNGGGTNIDLMFVAEEKLLRVHEEWLDFERIHGYTECEYYQLRQAHQVDKDFFMCDHVAQELLETALDEIRGPLELSQGECVALRSKVEKRIRQMPRLIETYRIGVDQLGVSWIYNESTILSEMTNTDILYQVVLHSTRTCTDKGSAIVDLDGKCLTVCISSLLIRIDRKR